MATKKESLSVVKETKKPKASSYDAQQLSLFQSFLANGDDSHLSNTIELWDSVPKFHVSYKRQHKMRVNGFLPTLEHEFQHRGDTYNVAIKPARINTGDGDIEFYPSPAEEILEDVLRKMASTPGLGYLDNNRSGISFTVHALKKELAARGHTRSFTQIHTSLLILAGCSIVLEKGGEGLYSSAILSSLLGVTRKRLEQDPSARWYADFSSLVTISIKNHTCRQFDYHRMLSHKKQLSRWFHKRLAHNYIQASPFNLYTILLSTIERDSCMLADKDKFRRLDRVRVTLKELIDDNVVLKYDEEIERGPRNSIIDCKFSLVPTPDFCKAIKAANARAKNSLKSVN